MQLSAPIYLLKRQAKLLARRAGIPLHQALNQLAIKEGFRAWSHLASYAAQNSVARDLISNIQPGALVLLGARPGHGKTLLGIEMAWRASEFGRRGYFFTLDYHELDVAQSVRRLGFEPTSVSDRVVIDTSDEISADFIRKRVSKDNQPALVVVDYLQLLDQKRSHPSLEHQIRALRDFVQNTFAICIVISQIDRSFDLTAKAMPDATDIRLPNPLDLSLFGKLLFLHDGQIRMERAA